MNVTDEVVKREGRRTGWALVGLSALVAAFCLSMMAYCGAAQLAAAGRVVPGLQLLRPTVKP